MVQSFLFRSSISGLVAVGLVGAAHAKPFKAAGVTASSSYPAEEGSSYEPSKVTDGKVATSWVEGDQGSGLGSWIELDLGGSIAVKEVQVWAGMWYSQDFWARANRPKEVEITLSDGHKITCNLNDEMAMQTCDLEGKETSSIKLKVKGTYDGSTWLDTAVSEVRVIDTQDDPRKAVASYDKSSALPTDADGNYEMSNISDGIQDTMWCEGNADGDGVGEWIEFQFDAPTKIANLELLNGIGGSVKYWMLGNRATGAKLEFSNGSSQTIEIKNSGRMQTIPLKPVTTDKVRMSFTSVYKGKEYNDLCISEAYFTE